MKDDYDYWKNALALVRDGKRVEGAVVSDPQCGFYRTKVKDGVPIPVAIFRDGAELVILQGVGDAQEEIDASKHNKVWQWVYGQPIPEEWYRKVEAGAPWPDMHAGLAGDGRELARTDNEPTEAIDPADALRDEILNSKVGRTVYLEIDARKRVKTKITDDEQLAAAQSLRSRMLELACKAEKTRTDLNRPHLDAMKLINDKWQPLVQEAKSAADQINEAMGEYADIKRAAAEKAERERLAAEAKKQAEEAAAQLAAQQQAAAEIEGTAPAAGPGEHDLFDGPPPGAAAAAASGLPPVPEPQPAPPVTVSVAPPTKVKGATGRAATGKLKTIVTAIDLDIVFAHFKADEDVREFFTTKAQRAIDQNLTVPGVTTEQKTRFS